MPTRKYISSYIKQDILYKQRNKCALCKETLTVSKDLDHRKPVRAGGKDCPSNLQYLCCNCHRKKTIHDNRMFVRCGKRAMRCRQCHHVFCTFFTHDCMNWTIYGDQAFL